MRSVSPYERYGEISPETEGFALVHTFDASETLTGLAHRVYGDWRQWRLIADRNNVVDARQVAPGTRLFIPELPREFGSFESR